MKKLIIALILISQMCYAGDIEDAIAQFRTDAAFYGVTIADAEIVVKIADVPGANGVITPHSNGSLVMVIDTEYYNWYAGKPQLKRLVYYLLGHALLKHNHEKGSSVMNHDRVYRRMPDRLVAKLFRTAPTIQPKSS